MPGTQFTDSSFTTINFDRPVLEINSTSSRKIIYGTMRVSGVLVFIDVTGANQEFWELVVILAAHESESIGSVFIDGLDSNNARYNGLVEITKHLGEVGQLADSNLVSRSADWTTSHKLTGLTYVYIRLNRDNDVFSSIPNIEAIVSGKKVFDPRTSTSVFSNNPALCIRDYLISSFGFNIPVSEINDSEVIISANICDQLVPQPNGTVARYTLNGVIDSASAVGGILDSMLTSMGGHLTFSQGVYSIIAASFVAPVRTLNESNLSGDLTVVPTDRRDSLFNTVRGVFIDPFRAYQSAEIAAVSDPVFVTEDNGEEIAIVLELPFTHDPYMGQRLAKIHLQRARQSIRVSMPCNFSALDVAIWDIISVDNVALGWSAKAFRVESYELTDNGVQMELHEESSTSYGWVQAEATNIDAAPNTNLPDPFVIAPPSALVVTNGFDVAQDGTVITTFDLSWTAPVDALIAGYFVEWKISTDSIYTGGTVSKENTVFSIQNVENGTLYDIRISAFNTLGKSSTLVSTTKTGAAKDTNPSTPTALTVENEINGVTLQWTNPADTDLSHTEIWEALVNDRSTAVLIAKPDTNVFTRLTIPENQTRYYWIRAVDNTGNISPYFPVSSAAGLSGLSLPAVPDASITPVKMLVDELSAIIANLGTINAGLLRSIDGTMEVNLNTKEIIMSGPAGVAADDYVQFSLGDLTFFAYDSATMTHSISKAVRHIETGVAANQALVAIPGFFKVQPSIIVSPQILQIYESTQSAADQTLQVTADGITENPANSGKWEFTPTAKLTSSSATGNTIVNVSLPSTSVDDHTTGFSTTPANCDQITYRVRFNSTRGTGTSNEYFLRQVTWFIEYRISGNTTWLSTTGQVKALGETLDIVSDSRIFNFPSAQTWEVRIRYLAADVGGTFISGSPTFEEAPDSPAVRSLVGDFEFRELYDNPGGGAPRLVVRTNSINLPGYTPMATYSIYQVDYQANVGWYIDDNDTQFQSGDTLIRFDQAGFIITDGNGDAKGDINLAQNTLMTWAGTTTYSTLLSSLHNIRDAQPGIGVAESSIKWTNPQATIRSRRPASNSTTPDNGYYADNYDFNLASAITFATGTVNWMAIGL